ncbi:unnamed protein product, partial [Phaeothamnion confervicola]
MHRLSTAVLLFLLITVAYAAPQSLPEEIADVRWNVSSTVFGDFTCRGQRDMALYGTSERSGFVVMIQPSRRGAQPSCLVFATRGREQKSIRLATESLDFKDDVAFRNEVKAAAPDLQPSKTCQGLALGDGETDSHHIYWNRAKKAFQ